MIYSVSSDPSRWEGHYLGARYLGALYIKTAKEALRAVAIDATASHTFSAGSYRSTELRKPLLLAADSVQLLPSSTAPRA